MKPTPVMAFTDNYAARVRARLADRIAVTPAGCWEWTGSRDRHGYGRMKVLVEGVKRETGAHRASWIVHRGAIPNPTLQTDHLCRNRACINPDHMELVTNQVNTLRSDHSGKAGRSGRRRGRQLHSCGEAWSTGRLPAHAARRLHALGVSDLPPGQGAALASASAAG